jgi:hypothetical protein
LPQALPLPAGRQVAQSRDLTLVCVSSILPLIVYLKYINKRQGFLAMKLSLLKTPLLSYNSWVIIIY